MTQIAGFPQGLLSLLGVQNFGENPRELGSVVAAVVDLRDQYMLQFQAGEAGSVAVPANGYNVAVTVPQTQVWRIHAGGLIVGTGAGVTLDVTPIMQARGAQVGLGSTLVMAANQTRWIPITAQPFWAEAGVTFGASISALVGAPSVQFSLLVSKLRA